MQKRTQKYKKETSLILFGDSFLSKDQAIGGAILVLCVAIALFYVVTLFVPSWLGVFGINSTAPVQFWIIAIPVFVAFLGIMLIGAWIGWTMATTPPPKPIEEVTTEIEEKKEEPAQQPVEKNNQ